MKASLQKGGCDEVEVSLSSHITRESMRGSGLKLQQGRLGLDIRKRNLLKKGGEALATEMGNHCPWRFSRTVEVQHWGTW